MFTPGVLTFREFAMQEPLPLATIQEAVLEFLRGRKDAVLFGAQAVNAYIEEARMSQDIDLLSDRPTSLADELRSYLADKFNIAVRVRTVGKGRGLRLYQVRKKGNRHLVDIQEADPLPKAKRIAGILVLAPVDLAAYKFLSYCQRRGSPKSGTDWRDLAMLVLAFPELKRPSGQVVERLSALGAGAEILELWKEFVKQDIRLPDE